MSKNFNFTHKANIELNGNGFVLPKVNEINFVWLYSLKDLFDVLNAPGNPDMYFMKSENRQGQNQINMNIG